MAAPLMPKATALWLLENTTLTFQQIADYCVLHILEVQALADGELGQGLQPFDPLVAGQLSEDSLERSQKDPSVALELLAPHEQSSRGKKARYTPLSRRKERPDAIAWLLKYHKHMSDTQIIRLVGTTKATIEAVRSGTHKNAEAIKPHNPVVLGLCTQEALEKAVALIPKKEAE